MRAAAGYDDPGRGKLGPVGFGERLVLERRNARARPAAPIGFDWRGAALAGRRERRRAHRDDLLGVGRLDRLDRVAGIDRTLERVGRDDLDDLRNLHHVEECRDARHDVLAGRGRGGHDRRITAGQRDDQRRQRFGQLMRVSRIVRHQHFFDAVEPGGASCGRASHSSPATRTWTGPPSALRGRQRLGGRLVELAVRRPRREAAPPSDHPGFVLELRDEFGDGGDLDASLAPGRLDGLQHLQPRRDIDAEIGRASSPRSASSWPS